MRGPGALRAAAATGLSELLPPLGSEAWLPLCLDGSCLQRTRFRLGWSFWKLGPALHLPTQFWAQYWCAPETPA